MNTETFSGLNLGYFTAWLLLPTHSVSDIIMSHKMRADLRFQLDLLILNGTYIIGETTSLKLLCPLRNKDVMEWA